MDFRDCNPAHDKYWRYRERKRLGITFDREAFAVERFHRGYVCRLDTGCYEWVHRLTKEGYPLFKIGATSVLVHRFAYEKFRGPIPPNKELDHFKYPDSCIGRACCNPWHVKAVTDLEHRQRHNSLKTHCKHGHEYTPDNTYRWRGRRHCRTCKRIQGIQNDLRRRGKRRKRPT